MCHKCKRENCIFDTADNSVDSLLNSNKRGHTHSHSFQVQINKNKNRFKNVVNWNFSFERKKVFIKSNSKSMSRGTSQGESFRPKRALK